MAHQQPYYDSASDSDTPIKKPTSILKSSPSPSCPSSPLSPLSSPLSTPSSPKFVHFETSDYAWEKLFNCGEATEFFDRFMRGIARMLINKEAGIGVTPKLLLNFYSTYSTRTSADHLYKALFTHSPSNYDRITLLFTALNCEFCLVSGRDPLHPNVPALSPAGFSTWMQVTTLAHPSTEAARLAAVVLDAPVHIDVPGSLTLASLPRTLPRDMFPYEADGAVLRMWKDAVDVAFPGWRYKVERLGVQSEGVERRGDSLELRRKRENRGPQCDNRKEYEDKRKSEDRREHNGWREHRGHRDHDDRREYENRREYKDRYRDTASGHHRKAPPESYYAKSDINSSRSQRRTSYSRTSDEEGRPRARRDSGSTHPSRSRR